MAKILPILKEPNEVLRARAAEVNLTEWKREDLEALAADMILTMQKAPGVGLAAPQIGQSIRLIIIEREGEPLALMNPVIIKRPWRKASMDEGCLSVPGKFGIIKRSPWVVVRAQHLDGSPFEIKAEGMLAEIFQHEIDHLDGILYIDKAEKFLN
ncbi:MAG: peptide deformylase [Patescibacteria group bacterium]